MGDMLDVPNNSNYDFIEASKENQILQQEAFVRQNWLQDKPEIIADENRLPKNKTFMTTPRQMLSGYSTFSYYYNPANYLYNQTLKK